MDQQLVKTIIGKVAEIHNIKLEENDPALFLVTANEVIIESFLQNMEKHENDFLVGLDTKLDVFKKELISLSEDNQREKDKIIELVSELKKLEDRLDILSNTIQQKLIITQAPQQQAQNDNNMKIIQNNIAIGIICCVCMLGGIIIGAIIL
ncbi:hypothetical protein CCZ01_09460 [Helicobacter monodelphidis]|uniref:hypothetical protein n=1 Tax=Helicobacter sp. 15-1451 TaxID=2004995 RepID=UPI000DCB7C4B|nr:hypothetical protein [Helicobacter sp. 15-1451]RAX56454.1 hypothetical protein CCZ01_09460 [Helicobacter sp. 15-1451]